MNARADTISPERIAQASAWVSTLHGDNRTAQTERALQRWLDEDPRNAEAFEQITELWEVTRTLPRRRIEIPDTVQTGNRTWRRAAIAAGITVVCVVSGMAFHQLRDKAISTDTGEQRIVALDDGTQVTLNTHTRLTWRFDDGRRHIELKEGEALFEVARDPSRPFTVNVGDKVITALGTRFAVRLDEHETSVTLIDGKVSVSTGQAPATSGVDRTATPAEVLLEPGQRLTLVNAAAPRIDQPQLDNVLAWKRREVFLNETPLHEAVDEMNRYSRKTLVVSGPDTDAIAVTGLFRAGDSLSFANAVADTYGLRVKEQDGQIRLER